MNNTGTWGRFIVSNILFFSTTLLQTFGHPLQLASKQPNILWIVVNDLSNDLGCYGNELVHTPNLDGLATEGIRYTNHFSTGAVCSPSRSAFITGMHAISINSHNHHAKERAPLPDTIIPITVLLKQQGYFLANCNTPDLNGEYKTGYNFAHDAEEMYDGLSWRDRKEGQPFFAQIHLQKVHRPFERDTAHPIPIEEIELPPYYPNHLLAKQDWAMYLETIQLMDKEVGLILEQLKEDGLDSNTVVFFFADHGRAHVRDKQFLYDGGVNVPLLMRWPGKITSGQVSEQLISNIDIAAASLEIAGIEKPEYMQGISFLHQGDPVRKYAFAARDRCDGTVDRIRMVRSREYKLIKNFYPERPYMQYNHYKWSQYPVWTLLQVLNQENRLNSVQSLFLSETRPEFELYHLVDDAHETKNLAYEPAHQRAFAELSAILDDWIGVADKGVYPEPNYDIQQGVEEMETWRAAMLDRIGIRNRRSLEGINKGYLKYWELRMQEFFR